MPKIHTALMEIMKECPAIGKGERNQQQGFMFRGIDTIYAELHNLFVKHGVISLPIAEETKTEERQTKTGSCLRFTVTKVTYRFMADDGSSVDCTMIGEGMDSGDKSASKSVAIAHKYALLQTFLIPTSEPKDPDYDSHEVAPKSQAPRQPLTDPNELLQQEAAKKDHQQKATW